MKRFINRFSFKSFEIKALSLMLPALSSPNTAARKEQLQQEAQEYKNKIDTQVHSQNRSY
jgi:hypothetical protein